MSKQVLIRPEAACRCAMWLSREQPNWKVSVDLNTATITIRVDGKHIKVVNEYYRRIGNCLGSRWLVYHLIDGMVVDSINMGDIGEFSNVAATIKRKL